MKNKKKIYIFGQFKYFVYVQFVFVFFIILNEEFLNRLKEK